MSLLRTSVQPFARSNNLTRRVSQHIGSRIDAPSGRVACTWHETPPCSQPGRIERENLLGRRLVSHGRSPRQTTWTGLPQREEKREAVSLSLSLDTRHRPRLRSKTGSKSLGANGSMDWRGDRGEGGGVVRSHTRAAVRRVSASRESRTSRDAL